MGKSPDTDKVYKPSEKQACEDKPRSVPGGGYVVEGSDTDMTAVVEYAVDFDGYDRLAGDRHGYPYSEASKKSGPKAWWLYPYRMYLNKNKDTASFLAHAKAVAEIQGAPGDPEARPHRVLKRTVVYGPWEEVVADEEETPR